MKRFLLPALALILALLFLRGGESRQREISRVLGTDVTAGTLIEDYDSHGGFHGDGYTCAVLQFPEGTELLPPGREDLPLPYSLRAAAYGVTEERGDVTVGYGPMGESGAPELPPIEHGWYWFYDENAERDPRDSRGLWNRGAFNYVLVLFDTDTDRLYYTKLDT